MLQIQAKISDALERGNLVSLLSLDLSAAFDLVDHNLLSRKMFETGVPTDVITLIENWLKSRTAYVEINGQQSYFFEVTKGTVQGSVLGPVLFAIFVKELIYLEDITIYADDNYLTCEADDQINLKQKITTKANNLIDWLTNNGMKVNIAKTELVVFGRKYTEIQVDIKGVNLCSKKTMRVLGVSFDYKMEWSNHINDVTKAVQKIQFGIRCLKKFLEPSELLMLVTTLGFSKLYYGAAVWLSRSLHSINQKQLIRTSAGLIKACLNPSDWGGISFLDLHEMAGKPTPMMWSDYYQAMAIKNICESTIPNLVWTKLQMNARYNQRNGSLIFGNGSVDYSGKMNLANRVQHVSTILPAGWDTMTIVAYKAHCKMKFQRH